MQNGPGAVAQSPPAAWGHLAAALVAGLAGGGGLTSLSAATLVPGSPAEQFSTRVTEEIFSSGKRLLLEARSGRMVELPFGLGVVPLWSALAAAVCILVVVWAFGLASGLAVAYLWNPCLAPAFATFAVRAAQGGLRRAWRRDLSQYGGSTGSPQPHTSQEGGPCDGAAMAPPTAAQVCTFHLAGRCVHGDRCRYLHIPAASATGAAPAPFMQPPPTPSPHPSAAAATWQDHVPMFATAFVPPAPAMPSPVPAMPPMLGGHLQSAHRSRSFSRRRRTA